MNSKLTDGVEDASCFRMAMEIEIGREPYRLLRGTEAVGMCVVGIVEV